MWKNNRFNLHTVQLHNPFIAIFNFTIQSLFAGPDSNVLSPLRTFHHTLQFFPY